MATELTFLSKTNSLEFSSSRHEVIMSRLNRIDGAGTSIPGPKGDTGEGVAAGGTLNQILYKLSGVDFATAWKTLTKGDVGLGNADNTSDTNKPVSTDQQTAIDLKANDSDFDQGLKTTDSVEFDSLTANGNVTAPNVASPFYGEMAQDPNGYFVVAGVIRNNGSGWGWIDDFDEQAGTGHHPLNAGTISTGGVAIVINYAQAGTAVITAYATMDETLAGHFLAGPSVGRDKMTLTIRSTEHIGGYVSFDGAHWIISANAVGLASAVWSTDKLVVTLSKDNPHGQRAHVTHRGGNYIVHIGGTGTSSVEVEFYDFAGTRITAPTSSMKIRLSLPPNNAAVNPSTINTATYPLGNIWVYALIRK